MLRIWNCLKHRRSGEHSVRMDPGPITLNRLEPGQRSVMHVEALVPTLLLTAFGVAVGLALRGRLGWPAWPFALIGGALALWRLIISPRRRWAAWGWTMLADELHVANGVWTQIYTVVPLARVQHIDVAQGPVERTFGVARLVLHTAGTAHAVVVLPGLARATAESLRDVVRDHVRAEAW